VAVQSSAGPLGGYLRALQAKHTLLPPSLPLRLRRSGTAAGERERLMADNPRSMPEELKHPRKVTMWAVARLFLQPR